VGRPVRGAAGAGHGRAVPLHTLRLGLAPYDIAQGKAHAAALLRAGLLEEEACAALIAGLDTLAAEVADGTFLPAPVR
jgi:argininosuccinate lyase